MLCDCGIFWVSSLTFCFVLHSSSQVKFLIVVRIALAEEQIRTAQTPHMKPTTKKNRRTETEKSPWIGK